MRRMKRDTMNYTLVGAIVVVALATLFATLLGITGTRIGEAEYVAHYDNVTGLAYGAPVYYEGFRVGHVSGITPERGKGRIRYRVDLAIRKDWSIPSDSIAKLASTGLLADISVAIHEGSSTQMLKPGAELRAQGGGDMFAAINDLATELSALTRDRIRPLVESLQTRVDSIGTEIEAATPVLLAEAKTLLTRLNQASAAVNDVLSPQNRERVANTLAGFETTADNAKALSAELRETQRKLDAVMTEAHSIAVETRPALKAAVADLAAITGSLARRIDAIAHNLEASSRHLSEFSREIRKHPNRLLYTPPADKVEVEQE